MKKIYLALAIILLVPDPIQMEASLLNPVESTVDDLTVRAFDIISIRQQKVISDGIIATTPDETQDFTDIELSYSRRAKRSTYHSANELPTIHADCVKAKPIWDKRVTRNKKKT